MRSNDEMDGLTLASLFGGALCGGILYLFTLGNDIHVVDLDHFNFILFSLSGIAGMIFGLAARYSIIVISDALKDPVE